MADFQEARLSVVDSGSFCLCCIAWFLFCVNVLK